MTDHLLEGPDETEASPGWLAGLAALLAAERDRWGLWAPVGVGSGIVLYFSLHAEPPGWLGALALGVANVGLARGTDKAPATFLAALDHVRLARSKFKGRLQREPALRKAYRRCLWRMALHAGTVKARLMAANRIWQSLNT